MKSLVGGLLDGTLTGLVRWYVQAHVARCATCQATLQALAAVRERLRTLATRAPSAAYPPHLSGNDWAAIEARWDALDQTST